MFTLSSYRLLVIFAFVLIGRCDYFGTQLKSTLPLGLFSILASTCMYDFEVPSRGRYCVNNVFMDDCQMARVRKGGRLKFRVKYVFCVWDREC